ncbi:fibrinogen-like protein A [Sabethes cyaneus]|uniref:fibrinogen-like protein A n=1 Tax=Sabethes cyaneus TaxID=53552 RepID=UPI00237D6D22|nr:fibrinogen-like protein A [Sabethes cyaneus]
MECVIESRSFTVSGFNSTGIGYELVTTNLEDINFNMQQLNSSQQKLSSEIQDLKITLAEIKSLFTIHTLVEREKLPETCVEVPNCRSGQYRIQPRPEVTDDFEVYCDHKYEDGGWTVIQNRYDGSVDFYRGWDQYESGFGDLQGEFWLGLRKIRELTYAKPHKLHIVMERYDGNSFVAKYSRFLIGGAKGKYLLKCLGNFSGNASDSLRRAYNKKFLTFDSDEDYDNYSAETNNCVANRKGAWWYDGCYASNLNGLYFKQIARQNGFTLMSWGIDFINFLKSSRMMIKATSEMNDDGSLCT